MWQKYSESRGLSARTFRIFQEIAMSTLTNIQTHTICCAYLDSHLRKKSLAIFYISFMYLVNITIQNYNTAIFYLNL